MKSSKTGAEFYKKEEGETLHNVMQGIETEKSRVVRVAILAQRQHEINLQIQAEMKAEIAELKSKNKTLSADLQATKSLLDRRTDGLSMIQRIAEAGGLVTTDRDDLCSPYQGKGGR
jgi:DNA-directed RNA polymerase subunit L